MSVPPLDAISAAAPSRIAAPYLPAVSFADRTAGAAFSDLLTQSVGKVEHDVRVADEMVRAFAVDDSIPVHQVTYALEHARLSVQLLMQVRARLVEGYQELLRMQL